MLVRLLTRGCLPALAWLLLITSVKPVPLVYGPKREATAAQLWNCSMVYPTGMDAPETLVQLYGRAIVHEVNGTGSILVLGNHNSGTSMVTRLLMLMGAFQGQLNGLSTNPNNRLKYWERIDVSHFHDMLLRAVSDARFKPYHAQDVNLSKLTPGMKRSLRCFVGRVVTDSSRHKPFVLKDPRMLLFTNFWLSKMPEPVCVYVYRDPVANAMGLVDNAKKSAQSTTSMPMTATRWLKTWEEGTMHALSACEGFPTLIVRLEEMQADLMRFMFKLYAMLHDAGIAGLQMPARHALSTHFGAFVHVNTTRHGVSTQDPPRLSQSQTALLQALQLIGNSPHYGLARSPMRARAVMDIYRDTMRSWAKRNSVPDHRILSR